MIAPLSTRRATLGLIAASGVAVGAFAALGSRAAPERLPAGDVERLNAALNLVYLGAQFHRHAATGIGLPADRLTGRGVPGVARGGRRVAFRDPALARYAGEIADDLSAHVAALRRRLGDAAAAQPALDLTPAAAPRPIAGDVAFLFDAFRVGDWLAACIRLLSGGIADSGAHATMTDVLTDAIYHGGLIRSLLAAGAAADPAIADRLASLCAMEARGGCAAAGTYAADLIDGEGRAVPFLRSPRGMPAAGFFPAGFNGIAA